MRPQGEFLPPEDASDTLFPALPDSPYGALGSHPDGDIARGVPSRELHEHEIALGLGFSVGFHALLAAAALCTLLFRPVHAPAPALFTVSLVSLGDSGGESGAAGEPGGAPAASEQPAASRDTELPPPPVIQPETPPVVRLEHAVPQPHKPKGLKQKRITRPRRETDRETPTHPEPDVELSQSTTGESHSGGTGTAGPGVMPGGEGSAGTGPGGGTAGAGTGQGRTTGGGAGELDLKQVDIPPTPIHKVEPDFPHMAKKNGISGRVVLKFLVRTDGSTGKASVIESSPPGVFDQSALEAVEKWKFKPGRVHGGVVATWVVLPIQFRLTR